MIHHQDACLHKNITFPETVDLDAFYNRSTLNISAPSSHWRCRPCTCPCARSLLAFLGHIPSMLSNLAKHTRHHPNEHHHP